MEVIAEVPNDAEALRLVGELSPDVVIMQVQMPFERARDTLKAMRSFPDPPKVVLVTMFESPHYVRGLTGVGASAYLLKTSSSEHLVAAVRAAVLDPKSENAVVGIPHSMLEGAEEGIDSVLSAPRRGNRQAPPCQRLPEDGRLLQGRGLKGGAPQGVDHHRGPHHLGARAGRLAVRAGLADANQRHPGPPPQPRF